MFGAVYKYFFLDEDTLKKVSLTAKNMFIHSLRNPSASPVPSNA